MAGTEVGASGQLLCKAEFHMRGLLLAAGGALCGILEMCNCVVFECGSSVQGPVEAARLWLGEGALHLAVCPAGPLVDGAAS